MSTDNERQPPTNEDGDDGYAARSPEQQAYEEAKQALRDCIFGSQGMYDAIRRLNRARADAFREENRAKYFDQWLTNFSQWLHRSREEIRLLSIPETYRLEDMRREKFDSIRQGAVPHISRQFPLADVHSVNQLLVILARNIADTPVSLLGVRMTDFGAIVSSSAEIFQSAITIVGDRDTTSISAISSDEGAGFILSVRSDPDKDPLDDDAPPIYVLQVWGDWVTALESHPTAEEASS